MPLLTLGVIVAVLAGVDQRALSPALTILGGAVALLVFGVIDARQAFSGFSNPAPLTVAALYVLAAAAGRTRFLEVLVERISVRSSPRRARRASAAALARMVVPTATASAVLNNTPIVAMAIPPRDWRGAGGPGAPPRAT